MEFGVGGLEYGVWNMEFGVGQKWVFVTFLEEKVVFDGNVIGLKSKKIRINTYNINNLYKKC
ncbi:hypothetical protein GCM10011343_02320 [Flavobacterium orientale]|uniref:Uncharacterized protein n=1 Tax=Flavobacterium orientale TaxID=1756020 RepID=A0A916XWB1_9FLAO|nr:hypothetical protein GCM10011343_02320 [Flavobacterium orientale]